MLGADPVPVLCAGMDNVPLSPGKVSPVLWEAASLHVLGLQEGWRAQALDVVVPPSLSVWSCWVWKWSLGSIWFTLNQLQSRGRQQLHGGCFLMPGSSPLHPFLCLPAPEELLWPCRLSSGALPEAGEVLRAAGDSTVRVSACGLLLSPGSILSCRARCQAEPVLQAVGRACPHQACREGGSH